jgi:hypothetical protein
LQSREAATEISQLRSGWVLDGNIFSSRSDGGKRPFSIVLSRRISFLRGNPATLWLANFQLSLSGRKSNVKNPI